MLTATDFLYEIHLRGATRINCVRFRKNRSTIWSLTQDGTVLNVHDAYRRASPGLLDAFATLAMEGEVRSSASRRAAREISSWPELADAIQRLREAHDDRRRGTALEDGVTSCCATPEQRAYLRAVYRYFNHTRFGGALPEDVPVRLSNRMRSALGHMMPGERSDGERYVVEIALNPPPVTASAAVPLAGELIMDPVLAEQELVMQLYHQAERGQPRQQVEVLGQDNLEPVPGRPGHFRWSAGEVLPGRYLVWVGPLHHRQIIEVRAPGTTDARIELDPPAWVQVHGPR